jgi:hypothetical protein
VVVITTVLGAPFDAVTVAVTMMGLSTVGVSGLGMMELEGVGSCVDVELDDIALDNDAIDEDLLVVGPAETVVFETITLDDDTCEEILSDEDAAMGKTPLESVLWDAVVFNDALPDDAISEVTGLFDAAVEGVTPEVCEGETEGRIDVLVEPEVIWEVFVDVKLMVLGYTTGELADTETCD